MKYYWIQKYKNIVVFPLESMEAKGCETISWLPQVFSHSLKKIREVTIHSKEYKLDETKFTHYNYVK